MIGGCSSSHTTVESRIIERTPGPGRGNGAAVIVLPGGGYKQHTKGEVWSEWLVKFGFVTFELRYQLEPRSFGGRARSVGPALEDALASVSLVQRRAPELGVDPSRVGVFASSAGAHLALCLCQAVAVKDRPVCSVLLYPPVRNPLCPCIVGSLSHFPRSLDSRVGWAHLHSSEHRWCQLLDGVEAQPPIFLVASSDDKLLPPNRHADLLAASLERACVPVLYTRGEFGGHGFGLEAPWPQDECVAWLRSHLCTTTSDQNVAPVTVAELEIAKMEDD